EPAEGTQPRLHHRLRRFRIGDIELDANPLRAGLGDKVERPGAVVDVAGDNPGTGRSEDRGDFLPEAARRGGDRSDLVLHIEHRSALKKHKPPLVGGGLFSKSKRTGQSTWSVCGSIKCM